VIEIESCLLCASGVRPGAALLVERLGPRAILVSNDATHTAERYALALRQTGITVPPQRIVLAGVAAVTEILTRFPGVPTLVIASRALLDLALSLGLVPAGDAPHVVLVANDRERSGGRLDRAVEAIERGAVLVAASADPWAIDPGPPIQRVLGPGTVLAAIRSAVRLTEPLLIGLPQPSLLRHAIARSGDDRQGVLLASADRSAAAQSAGLGFLAVDHDQGGLASLLNAA